MRKKETKDKREKEKFTDFGSATMGHGMFEMIAKCCTSQNGFPDCSTMMKGMKKTMRNQPCCTPQKDAAESERRKK